MAIGQARLEYLVGFNADTTQLRRALTDALSQLNTLGSTTPITSNLQSAAAAALELRENLAGAVNAATGQLDLKVFNDNLARSGKTLSEYAMQLYSLGPAGQQAFSQVASAITMAELPLKRSNKLMSQLWVTMQNTMRWQLTSSMLRGFIGAVQTAYGYTKDLNESLNNIRIVTGKSVDNMREYSKYANEAAKSLSATTLDYTDASLIYYQQGLGDKAVQERTETTIKLANVSRQAAEDVSNQMTAIWNNFDDGSKKLEYYADVITALGATTASSSEEIAGGVEKFAAIAETVGLSYEYSASALATIVAATRQSEETVGTGLRTILGRIESINLGETLDDGVTLTKYTKALEAAGVSVLDTNGQLKKADVILDSIAAKWQTMTETQQQSLAYTVGGVRQYANVLALFNNWDDMQRNVETALGSEGTLQRQADIYAQSWEAARDRVRAASEDIYDSLINEDFFIGLDNALTPFLTNVATLIDSMGGMGGVLTTLVYLMNQAFGDKIAASMQNMVTNLGFMTGQERERARAIQQEAAELQMFYSIANTGVQGPMVEASRISNDLLSYQIQMNREMDTMNERQRELVQEDIQHLKILAQKGEELARQTVERTEQAEQARVAMQTEMDNNTTTVRKYTAKGTLTNNGHSYNYRNSPVAEVEQIISKAQTGAKAVEALKQRLADISPTKGNLRGVVTTFDELEKLVSRDEAIARKLQRALLDLDASADNNAIYAKYGQLAQELEKTEAESAELKNALRTLFPEAQSQIEQYVAQLEAAGQSTESLQKITEMFNQALLEQQGKNYMASNWAEQLVNIGSSLTSISMTIQYIRNLGSIWTDESLSTGEQMLRTLSTAGMLLPSIVSLTKLATKAQTKKNTVIIAGTTATKADILAENAKTAALGKHTTSTILNTKTVNGNTVAVVANTTAWYANPMFWAAAAIVAGIVAITAVITANEQAIKKQNEALEKSSEDATEYINSTKEVTDANTKLIQSYFTLRSTMEDSEEGHTAIRNKALEVAEALGIELSALTLLNNQWDEFDKKVAEEQIKKAQTVISQTTSKQGDIYDNIRTNSKYSGGGAYKNMVALGNGKSITQEESDLYKQIVDASNGLLNLERKTYSAGDGGVVSRNVIETPIEDINQLFKIYDYLSQWYTDVGNLPKDERDKIKKLDPYKKIVAWLTGIEDDIETLRKSNGVIEDAINSIAIASLELQDQDVEDIDTRTEYEAYRRQYISILKQKLSENENLLNYLGLTNDSEISDYVEKIADTTLGKYSPYMGSEIQTDKARDDLYSAVQQNFIRTHQGISNPDRAIDLANAEAQKFVDYINNELAGALGGEVTNEQIAIAVGVYTDGKSLEKFKYGAVKAIVDARMEANQELLSATTDIMSTLFTKGENALTEDQLKIVQQLESEYSELAEIRDRGSAQYIQALRDIREGLENAVSSDAMSQLNKAWEQLQRTYKSIEDSDEVEVSINVNDKNFKDKMRQIMDADYAVQVAIEADLKSEVDDILQRAGAATAAAKLIQEGFKVAYDDIDAVANAFPGILAGYIDVADGMIQLNSSIAQSAVDLAGTQIESDKEACKQNIENYKQVLLSKAAAMRKIAEGLWDLADTSKDTGDAEAKIQEGLTDLESACADEKELISKGLAESEIDDANQIMKANENAAGTSANNWANAYNSMQKNSADWARIAIANANKVAQAMKGAQEGKVVTPEVSTGGIFSSYGGGFEEAEYANTYESRGQGNVSWQDYYDAGDYEAAAAAAIKSAEQYESAASQLDTFLAKIDGATQATKNLVKELGKGSGKTKKLVEDLDLDEFEEHFHEINKLLEKQKNLLDDVGKKIDRAYGVKKLDAYDEKLKALNKQSELLGKKMTEAVAGVEYEWGRLQKLAADTGITITKDENDYIDYTMARKQLEDWYKKVYEPYVGKEQDDATKAILDAYAKTYKDYVEWLDAYEKAVEAREEVARAQLENIRETRDTELDKLEYKLEVIIEVKDIKKAAIELKKTISESFGDILTHGLDFRGKGTGTLGLSAESIKQELSVVQDFKQQKEDYESRLAQALDEDDRKRIIKDLEDLQSKAIASAEALLEWAESLEDVIPDAVDAATSRVAQFTDQLEHNTSIVDAIKELYALQGVTYRTAEGYKALYAAEETRANNAVATAKIAKTELEGVTPLLEAARKELDAYVAKNGEGGDQYDRLKKKLDAYQNAYNEYESKMYESAKEAMEALQAMYELSLNRAVSQYEKALGLETKQQQFERYTEAEERYLDAVNEEYQKKSWYNKLQADIDKQTSNRYKEQLKLLKDEIDIRAEGGTLSEYDLKILEAKYKVLQATMALEDVENNKTQLRQVRDRQGNWTFQYTVDPDAVAGAQQALLDAQNEYYNIAKQQTKDLAAEIIATQKEFDEAILQLYQDRKDGIIASDDELKQRIDETNAFYTEKMKFLYGEQTIAVNDMTEAGKESIDDFDNKYAEDLSNMTGNLEDWETAADGFLDDCETAWEEYGSKVKEVADATGTTVDELNEKIRKLKEETGKLEQAGINLATSIWEKIIPALEDEVNKLNNDLHDAIWNAISDYEDLADAIAKVIEQQAELDRVKSTPASPEPTPPQETPTETTPEPTTPAPTNTGGGTPTMSHSDMVQLVVDMGVGKYANNPNRRQLVEQAYPGMYSAAQSILNQAIWNDDWNYRHNGTKWRETVSKYATQAGFATGGYTGEFSGAKLALLHEKELVLNQEDTQNILSAVSAVRTIGPALFAEIEKMLDGDARAALTLMAARLGGLNVASAQAGALEQHVTIEHVEFPNVSSSDEIQKAFVGLVNDAAQWAQKR